MNDSPESLLEHWTRVRALPLDRIRAMSFTLLRDRAITSLNGIIDLDSRLDVLEHVQRKVEPHELEQDGADCLSFLAAGAVFRALSLAEAARG